ncbi:MAG: glycosyl hydrolase, partial [Bacteroidetes bacterium]
TLPTGHGIHRFNWDLRRDPIRHIDGFFVLGDYAGGLVAPGYYTLRLRVGDEVYTERAQLLADPRLQVPQGSYAEQQMILDTIAQTVADIHSSVEMMQELRDQMQALRRRLGSKTVHAPLLAQADSIVAKIDRWTGELVQPAQQTSQDVINFPNRLNAELMNLHSRCDGIDPRVTQGTRERLQDLLAAWAQLRSIRDEIIQTEMAAFNALYAELKLPALFLPDQEVLDAW